MNEQITQWRSVKLYIRWLSVVAEKLLRNLRTGFLFLSCVLLLAGEARAEIRLDSSLFEGRLNLETMELTATSDASLAVLFNKLKENSFEIKLTNRTEANLDLSVLVFTLMTSLSKQEDPGGGVGASFYSYLDAFAKVGDNIWKPVDNEPVPVGIEDWFGFYSHYYLEAIRFEESDFLSDWKSSETETEVRITLAPKSGLLHAGETKTIRFRYLHAPKSRSLLTQPDIDLEVLLLSNLWGWLRSLCFLFWDLLDALYEMIGNWGLTIILLALIIRLLTIPLTRFSLAYQKLALEQQTRFKPLLQEIKKDYKGVEQSEKIIELYETQGYDHLAPFKSMLGLFIQIPIFVALFNVLGDAFEISGQGFLWIEDLAKSDRILDWGVDIPYFGRYLNLLPVVMAAVTIASTWLAGRTKGKENTPTFTMFGMGGFFFVLFYSFPAALVLYWMSSNFFQLMQQSFEDILLPKKE